MKDFLYLTLLCCGMTLIVISCGDDDDPVPTDPAPSNLVINIENPADGTGMVTVRPTATNADQYIIDWGDGTDDTAIQSGSSAQHQYTADGTYTVTVDAIGASNQKISGTQSVTIAGVDVVAPNCTTETSQNIDPAMGPIRWTYINDDEGFNAFGNIESAILENPAPDAVNESCRVQSYIKTDGCETWSGVGATLPSAMDFSSTDLTAFTLKVFAVDHPTEVTLRLEFMSHPDVEPAVDIVQMMSGTGAWEELTFDFSDHKDKTFSSMIIYYDRNQACDDATYYFDDLTQIMGTGGGGGGMTCTEETSENTDPANGPIQWTYQTGTAKFDAFGNIESTIVPNPVEDAINGSCRVQSYIKTEGCETWSGVGVALASSLDFTDTDMTAFTLKVLAMDHPTEVTLRLEFMPHPNTEPAVDIVQMMSGTGAWEELTFDFSDHTDKTFSSMIIYFDRNQACDGATYYFDDLTQIIGTGGGGGGMTCTEETSENTDPTVGALNWTFQSDDAGFEAFGGIQSTIVNNTVVDAINSSCRIQNYIKTGGCETWSGVGKALDNAIDLTASGAQATFKMKVLAVDHPTEVTLRLEFMPHPDVEPAVDVVQTMAGTGAWEELTFDFSAHTDKTFRSIIIYFDRNQACDGAIYYFDDIRQE